MFTEELVNRYSGVLLSALHINRCVWVHRLCAELSINLLMKFPPSSIILTYSIPDATAFAQMLFTRDF